MPRSAYVASVIASASERIGRDTIGNVRTVTSAVSVGVAEGTIGTSTRRSASTARSQLFAS